MRRGQVVGIADGWTQARTTEDCSRSTRATAATARWPRDRIFEYFPALRERRHQKGRSLSGGEQPMLAVARALGELERQRGCSSPEARRTPCRRRR